LNAETTSAIICFELSNLQVHIISFNIMNVNTLLAFLIALQDSNADVLNDVTLKQLRNKFILMNRQSEITSKDWENVQRKLTTVLENRTIGKC